MAEQRKAPSEEFLYAFTHAGTGVIQCGFCHRTHFVSNPRSYDWDEGEYEELERGAKESPDKFVVHEASSIRWGMLDGIQYVSDCPCNGAGKYEQFILAHRHDIAQYLKARAEKHLKDAQRDSDLVKSLDS